MYGARIKRGRWGLLNVALSSEFWPFPVFLSFYFTLKLLGAWRATDFLVGKRRGEANYVALEHDRKSSFGQQQTLQSNC